jgi:hypothetical protein
MKRFGQLVAETLDGHLHELAAPPASPVPRVESHARSPSAANRGEFQYGACNMPSCSTMSCARDEIVGVSGVRKPAAGRFKVFEHHHVAIVVGVGVVARGTRTGTSHAKSR